MLWEGGRLVLVDRDDRELAALDWPRRPAAVRAGGPSGRGDARSAGVGRSSSAPRRRLARVRVRRQALRVLDGERKTVARLVVEEPSIAGDGARAGSADCAAVGDRRPGIRQGAPPGAARRRGRARSGRRAAQPLADEAVARSGGTPGGVSSKLDVPLEPAQRADGAAVVILTQLTAAIEANLPGTLARRRQRVPARPACRRSQDPIAAARAQGRVPTRLSWPASGRSSAGCRRSRARVATSTSTCWSSTSSRARCREAQRRDLEPLRVLLSERRVRERRRMVRALRSARTAHAARRVEAAHRGARRAARGGSPRRGAPGRRGRRAADRASSTGRWCKMGGAIDDDEPAGRRCTSCARRARSCATCSSSSPASSPRRRSRRWSRRSSRLQDTLGRFQDREVQAEMLRSLGDEIAARENGAAALMAMGVPRRASRAPAGRGARRVRASASPRSPPSGARAAVKETFR